MPVGTETLMTSGMKNFYPGTGTTLCPHCDTRFRIAAAQLEAHHGMVRCGHCLQAFDARAGFIPDQPNPQLELPILDEPAAPAEELPAAEVAEVAEVIEVAEVAEVIEVVEEIGPIEETASVEKTGLIVATPPTDEAAAETEPPEIPHTDQLDFNPPAAAIVEPDEQPMTLAEQVAIVQDEDEGDRPSAPAYRRWPWAIAAFLLLLVLFAQAAYFFRVDLAARLPGLKPALTGYCKLLGCSVPLPQKPDLMSIESSDLEADPTHVNQITLNALLRNRAPYAQAFPNLELTLNDTQDKPLARRIFKPKDYLPPLESEQTGLLPNRELSVKLYLNTADLRPIGYRLVLFYPKQ
ncbi:MAG: hypothetical protein A2W81_02540 [Betaproteobacteria bacterium RIFCSPLOWO2_12_61_14]|nr:MAG: hypothetical protein A2W81_02540 [Betaproteobacteria bacterium RIFCSPLOWO2_12_61_14]